MQIAITGGLAAVYEEDLKLGFLLFFGCGRTEGEMLKILAGLENRYELGSVPSLPLFSSLSQ